MRPVDRGNALRDSLQSPYPLCWPGILWVGSELASRKEAGHNTEA